MTNTLLWRPIVHPQCCRQAHTRQKQLGLKILQRNRKPKRSHKRNPKLIPKRLRNLKLILKRVPKTTVVEETPESSSSQAREVVNISSKSRLEHTEWAAQYIEDSNKNKIRELLCNSKSKPVVYLHRPTMRDHMVEYEAVDDNVRVVMPGLHWGLQKGTVTHEIVLVASLSYTKVAVKGRRREFKIRPRVVYVFWRGSEHFGTPVSFGQLEKVIVTRLFAFGVASPESVIDMTSLFAERKLLQSFVDHNADKIDLWCAVPTLPIVTPKLATPTTFVVGKRDKSTRIFERKIDSKMHRLEERMQLCLETARKDGFTAGELKARKNEERRRTRAIGREVTDIFNKKIQSTIKKEIKLQVSALERDLDDKGEFRKSTYQKFNDMSNRLSLMKMKVSTLETGQSRFPVDIDTLDSKVKEMRTSITDMRETLQQLRESCQHRRSPVQKRRRRYYVEDTVMDNSCCPPPSSRPRPDTPVVTSWSRVRQHLSNDSTGPPAVVCYREGENMPSSHRYTHTTGYTPRNYLR